MENTKKKLSVLVACEFSGTVRNERDLRDIFRIARPRSV